jgi:hypothetical protein|tara:strand:- start:190 stop:390 length:201 start_codon:yes stop_codon:yes gene_type:complete
MPSFTVNNKDYSHKELNKIYDFFTQDQWDVIDQALDCYAQSEKYVGVINDTGEIRDAMYQLLRTAY